MIPLIDILSYVNRPLAHWIFLHLAISKFFTSSWCVLHALAYVEARATASSTQLYCSTLYITRPQTQHLVTSLQCIYYCIFYRPLVRLFQPQATQCVHHSAEGTLAETSPVLFCLSALRQSIFALAHGVCRSEGLCGGLGVKPPIGSGCTPSERGRDQLYRSLGLGKPTPASRGLKPKAQA